MNNILHIDPIYGLGVNGFGFFSNYRACLHRLIANKDLLDTHLPYISWKNTFFADKFKVESDQPTILSHPEHHPNPFDFWFEQSTPDAEDAVHRADGSIDSNLLNHSLDYFNTPELLEQKYMDSRYITLKPSLKQSIENIYSREFKGQVVLGINARGTDHIDGHPEFGSFTLIDYIECITKVLDRHKDITKIYVVSEDQHWVEAIQKHFDNVYYSPDVNRWDKSLPYNSKKDKWYWPYLSTRKDHGKRLGEEVIIQTKLLGKCDYLMGRHSGVLCGAVLWGENINQLYKLDEVSQW